ncbi:MAG TPA: sigma-70 family RNA polymerase sigma factor [Bacteroidia bacterium]|nr:sigma-70 family RNA polymerase sigma factor [Bacteroidia bacterium]
MNAVLNTPQQFQNWYESFQCTFMNIGLSLGYRQDEVCDFINQFFLDLLEKKIDPANINNPQAYLSTAFRRKLIDHYRQSDKSRLEVVKDIHENYAEPSIQETLEQIESNKELINSLKNAYKKLPARCRKVIDLKFYKGLTTEGIALQTGLSKRTINNNLFEGIKILRIELSENRTGKHFSALLSLFPLAIAATVF